MKRKAKILIMVSCMMFLFYNMTTMSHEEEQKQIEEITVEFAEKQAEIMILQEEVKQPESIPWEDIPISGDEQVMMKEMCDQLNISYAFALAVMESESGYDPEAVGDGGESIGYYQINSINWPRMQDEYGLDVTKPIDNLAAGIYILAELFEKYDDPYLVIECYKCGESRGKELYYQGIYKTEDFDCEAICERSTEIERSHGL